MNLNFNKFVQQKLLKSRNKKILFSIFQKKKKYSGSQVSRKCLTEIGQLLSEIKINEAMSSQSEVNFAEFY